MRTQGSNDNLKKTPESKARKQSRGSDSNAINNVIHSFDRRTFDPTNDKINSKKDEEFQIVGQGSNSIYND